MKSQTCWTNGPRPNLTPPRGTRRTLPIQRLIGPRPISPFSLYITSILPNRSPTDFFFLTQPRGTFCFSFIFFFYTTSWRRAEVPDTLLKRSPTDLCFLFLSFSYTTSQHRAEVFEALLKRSTMTMRPDKQNQTLLSEHNGPRPKCHVPQSSQRKRKKKKEKMQTA